MVNTHPQKEFVALANIQRQGFEVFLPVFLRSYPRLGDRLRPLFPNYLFVQFNPDTDPWYPICHTYGVKRLFATNPPIKKKEYSGYIRPLPIDDAIIMSLKQQIITPTHNSDATIISPGARVRVITGHFENQEGICSWSSSKRVELLLAGMNGEVKFTFSRDSVECMPETQP